MLKLLLFCTSAAAFFSLILLITFGHRVRRGSLPASLLLTMSTAAVTSFLLGSAVQVSDLSSAVFVGVSASLSLGLALRWPSWNPFGHAAFAFLLLAVTTFILYAGHALFVAPLAPGLLVLGCLLLCLQIAALALLLAHTFEIIDVTCRFQWKRRASRKIIPGYRPRVSLHVPIHNEPPDLVLETLAAIARLDYTNYEVLVVDNNTTDERLWRPVEKYCKSLGPQFRFFHLPRWPGYKAGALNFALSQTDPSAELVGIVDADYQVKPRFLDDLVGHFANPRVGFVQTPQDYRDGAGRGRFGRALYLAYWYFFKVSMASRNERNGIIFVGTMGLVRRSALMDAGGWDEWCITEDAEVSLRLLDAGYESIYVDRSYGRGLMPLDLPGLKKQRFRWAFGGMQLLRMHARRLFLPGGANRLTWAQRFAYLGGGLQWLNDPLSFLFTLILLVGAAAFCAGIPFNIQPLAGASFAVPLLFIVTAVFRFVWALRVRTACTRAEAWTALSVLLGLTWVTTQACVLGLVRRQGTFLRTAKQGNHPSVIDSVRGVRVELLIGGLCLGVGHFLLTVTSWPGLAVGQVVAAVLLFWQGAIYLSAGELSWWSLTQRDVRTKQSERSQSALPKHRIRVPARPPRARRSARLVRATSGKDS